VIPLDGGLPRLESLLTIENYGERLLLNIHVTICENPTVLGQNSILLVRIASTIHSFLAECDETRLYHWIPVQIGTPNQYRFVPVLR
jgi:hypothetical protein